MTDPYPPPPGPPSPPPYAPPPPPPAGGAAGDSGNRTIMLILSYFGILALIPFLVEKNDREVQWHAKHGLVLCGAEIALWIVLMIVNAIVGMVFAPASCLLSVVFLLLALGILAFHVYLMVKAVNGERVLIPNVSQYADRF